MQCIRPRHKIFDSSQTHINTTKKRTSSQPANTMSQSSAINRNSYLYANEESPKMLKKNMSVQTLQAKQNIKKQFLNVVSSSRDGDRGWDKKGGLSSVKSFSLMIDRTRDSHVAEPRNPAIVVRDKLVPERVGHPGRQHVVKERVSLPHHNQIKQVPVVVYERPASARGSEMQRQIVRQQPQGSQPTQLRPCQSASLIARPASTQPLKMDHSVQLHPPAREIVQTHHQNMIQKQQNQNAGRMSAPKQRPSENVNYTFRPSFDKADQQKYNMQLMNKLSLDNPKKQLTQFVRVNPQQVHPHQIRPDQVHPHPHHLHQQNAVGKISESKLTLQGPPAMRVITKQEIIPQHNNNHIPQKVIVQKPIPAGPFQQTEAIKLQQQEPEKPKTKIQIEQVVKPQENYQSIPAEDQPQVSITPPPVQPKEEIIPACKNHAQSLTASLFFNKMPQSTPTLDPSITIHKLSLELLTIQTQRKQTEDRISQQLDEIQSKTGTFTLMQSQQRSISSIATPYKQPLSDYISNNKEKQPQIVPYQVEQKSPIVIVQEESPKKKGKGNNIKKDSKKQENNKQNNEPLTASQLRNHILTRIFS